MEAIKSLKEIKSMKHIKNIQEVTSLYCVWFNSISFYFIFLTLFELKVDEAYENTPDLTLIIHDSDSFLSSSIWNLITWISTFQGKVNRASEEYPRGILLLLNIDVIFASPICSLFCFFFRWNISTSWLQLKPENWKSLSVSPSPTTAMTILSPLAMAEINCSKTKTPYFVFPICQIRFILDYNAFSVDKKKISTHYVNQNI